MNKQELLAELVLSEEKNGLAHTLDHYYGSNFKVSIGYSRHACETSIDDIPFSVRSLNALKRASIFTVGAVIDALNQGQIETIRNLGKKSVCEIKTRILVFGFDQLTDREKVEFFISLIQRNPEKTEKICEGDMKARGED